MRKQIYISNEERKKCQKVAYAFTELYDLTDIVVSDAGKYGFVKLYCYEPKYGFYKMTTFTNGDKLFYDLWTEWWHKQVITLASETSLIELDYQDILKALPKGR